MPRPKRTKVASTAARVAKPSQPAEPSIPTQKQTTSRKTAKSKPVESAGEDANASVGRSTRTRRRASQSQVRDNLYPVMTGALPAAREMETAVSPTMHRTPPSHASRRTRTSRGSAEQASTKKSPRTVATRGSAHKDTSYLTMEEGDSSGFGDHMLSFTSLDSNSPAHGTRPPSAIKVGATPAHERSILALTNFKRRARQPSLLRMVHQTTDLEDNDGENMDLYADDLDDCECHQQEHC